TGIGLAAASLVIEPTSQDLGTVLTGGGSSATFAVKNPGGLPTGAVTLALTGANASEMTLASDGCTGTPLAAGASCSVTVNFAPTGTGTGAKAAQLGAHATPGGDAAANLTATVAAPGALVISPPSVDFGGVLVGSSTTMPSAFTITNTGGTPSGPLALALGGSGSAQFLTGTDGCTGQTLVAGAACTVSFSFRPTTAGNKTASLVVMATPGGVGAAALIGRGLAPAALAANAMAALGTVDVGSTGASTTWTIRNTGDVSTGALATAATGSPGDFTVMNSCTGMLGAGASCAIVVALSPKSGGDKTVTLAVMGAPGGTVSLVATGTGRPAQQLSVMRAGNGMGAVTSDMPGINCGATCGAGYRHGTVVTLTPLAAAGSTFGGWTGACTGTGVCSVTMTAAQSVTATFTLNRYTLSVTTSGATTGTVTSAPVGIACGPDCSEAYNHGTVVTLTATPAAGWAFGGWAGACTGTGACAVTMTQARSVTATFTQNSYALSVSVAGAGRVTSTPAGIDCGSDCGDAYPSGQVVQLSATAAAGYTFATWGGACTGAVSPCAVTMSQARDVTATFRANPVTLSVVMRGNGRVTSSPAGIVCDTSRTADCSETYLYGDRIVLTATPAAGSDNTWSGGGCTGNGPTCTVTLTAATTVNVDFVLRQVNLGVKLVGAAATAGQVASTDQMIDCPAAKCEASYPYGTQVTLSAIPAPGKAVFVGWDWPDCKPVNGVPPTTCVVPLLMSTTVLAQFELPVHLTVRVGGTGGALGSVSSSPAGINACSVQTGVCTAIFPPGATVRLTATAMSGSSFTSWDKAGPCGSFGAEPVCTFDVKDSNLVVTATFTNTKGGITIDPRPVVIDPGPGVVLP
ncbi:MAG: choice-of-anchor D domain-containing protein, partial [Bacteroidota bacterium]